MRLLSVQSCEDTNDDSDWVVESHEEVMFDGSGEAVVSKGGDTVVRTSIFASWVK